MTIRQRFGRRAATTTAVLALALPAVTLTAPTVSAAPARASAQTAAVSSAATAASAATTDPRVKRICIIGTGRYETLVGHAKAGPRTAKCVYKSKKTGKIRIVYKRF